MKDKKFSLIGVHINEKNSSKLIFWGETYSNQFIQLSAVIDGQDTTVRIYGQDDRVFQNLINTSNEKIDVAGEIEIPEKSLKNNSIHLTMYADGNRIVGKKIDLNGKHGVFIYNLEKTIYRDDGSVDMAGWAIDNKPVEVRFFTGDGSEIPVEKKYRRDLYSAWPELGEEDLNAGFSIKIPKEKVNDYPWLLQFQCTHGIIEIKFTKRTSFKEDWKAAVGVKRAVARSY